MSYHHGSARFATQQEIWQAGFLSPSPNALQLGFYNHDPLFHSGDAHITTVAGSGAGKLRDIIAYVLLQYRGPMVKLDPKGELTVISLYHQHRLNVKQYCYNPYRLHGLPHHDLNPLSFLSLGSISLNSDVMLCAQNFVVTKNLGENESFAKSGQRWFAAFVKLDLEHFPVASLPRIYSYIKMIESNPKAFKDVANLMQYSRFEDVADVAHEIYTKQRAPKEFTAIMGTLHNALSFLNEQTIANSLENPEFALENIIWNPGEPASKIAIIIPAEYIEINSSLIRLIFTAEMLVKQQAPHAPPVLHLIDEAGQLGPFQQLLHLYAYGRGGGNKIWSFWQSTYQMDRNLGSGASSIIFGSSQVRQFFGIRDPDVAEGVSKMAGVATAYYDDELQQASARHEHLKSVCSLLEGRDPVLAAHEARMHYANSRHQQQMSRELIKPDEVMRIPSDEQLILASDEDACPYPIRAKKYPYYEQGSLAGTYLPNPFHPPGDSVQVCGRFGKKWAQVVEADPPAAIRDWPQFKNGFKKIKGYL